MVGLKRTDTRPCRPEQAGRGQQAGKVAECQIRCQDYCTAFVRQYKHAAQRGAPILKKSRKLETVDSRMDPLTRMVLASSRWSSCRAGAGAGAEAGQRR